MKEYVHLDLKQWPIDGNITLSLPDGLTPEQVRLQIVEFVIDNIIHITWNKVERR